MENNKITSNKTSNNEVINLREIAIKYLRKWYWFVISFFVCLTIGYFYLKITVPTFKVQTTILLRKEDNNLGFSEMAILESMGMSGSSKEVEDETQVLKSMTLMKNVIKDLSIETEYYEKKGMRYEDTYPEIPIQLLVPTYFNDTVKEQIEFRISPIKNGYKIKYESGFVKETIVVPNFDKPISTAKGKFSFKLGNKFKKNTNYKIITYPTRVLTDAYQKNIVIAAVNKKSNAISINTIAANVFKAKSVLDKLIELYNLDAVLDKNMIATNTKKFVDERLELIKNELLNEEINVENYKKQNNLTNLSSEAGLYLQTSSEYNKKLAEIETQINLIKYIENHIKDNRNQYSLIPANLGLEDNSLISSISNYNIAIMERMKLLRTTNNENPVITQIEQQLKTLRDNILTSISNVKDGMNIAKNDLKGKEAQFAGKINKVPTQERKYLELKRQQEIKQELYVFLLQKREENALSLASAVPTAKTLDSAYSSIEPVSPKTIIVLALILVFTLLFPIGIIYIQDLLNNKIVDRKELKRLINAPYLGSIGINKEENKVVVREGKTSAIVEMFRMLRTNLQFMLGGKKSPVILITSSIGGEGKSFTAINLAMSFALLNKKTVLIGLDIRKPVLGEYMHIAKNKGVSLYLSDPNYNIKDIIIPSGISSFLQVIPAGPIPPNPAELLLSSRLEELIEGLKNEFDYIIIDSAPVGVVSDTYLLNRIVDNSVYVSRQGYSPRDVTELINEIYDNHKLNNLGVVLNGVDDVTSYGNGYYATPENYKK